MLGGAGRLWTGGAEDMAVAAAMAGAGLAKSVLGMVECNGEALGGESGILDWEASTAALFPNGLAEGGPEWGSLNGFSAAGTFAAAPGRSQALLGRSGRSRSLDNVRGAAAATPSMLFPLLLLFSKAGSNWVTGLRLRRGAVDMVRSVRTLGAAGAAVNCT
jgi:hypothetical protein